MTQIAAEFVHGKKNPYNQQLHTTSFETFQHDKILSMQAVSLSAHSSRTPFRLFSNLGTREENGQTWTCGKRFANEDTDIIAAESQFQSSSNTKLAEVSSEISICVL